MSIRIFHDQSKWLTPILHYLDFPDQVRARMARIPEKMQFHLSHEIDGYAPLKYTAQKACATGFSEWVRASLNMNLEF